MKESEHGFAPGADVLARSLLAHVQRRIEVDRSRIAGELHDEVSGTLAAARMDVSWLKSRLGSDPELGERLERLDAAVDRANRAARQIMQRLRPALLDHFGLPIALRNLVEETCRAAGATCDLAFVDAVEGVDPDLQIATYRLVEELLAGGVGDVVVGTLQQDHRSSVLVISPSRNAPPGDDRRADIAARRAWIESLGGSCTVPDAEATEDVTTVTLPRVAATS